MLSEKVQAIGEAVAGLECQEKISLTTRVNSTAPGSTSSIHSRWRVLTEKDEGLVDAAEPNRFESERRRGGNGRADGARLRCYQARLRRSRVGVRSIEAASGALALNGCEGAGRSFIEVYRDARDGSLAAMAARIPHNPHLIGSPSRCSSFASNAPTTSCGSRRSRTRPSSTSTTTFSRQLAVCC